MLKINRKLNNAIIRKNIMVDALKKSLLKRDTAASDIFIVIFLVVVALVLVIIFKDGAIDIVNSVMQSVKTKVSAIFN